MTLHTAGPSGRNSFELRAPESLTEASAAGALALGVQTATISADGALVVAELRVEEDLSDSGESSFATSSYLFDLVGTRVGQIESGDLVGFTARSDALVYEDVGGALSFVATTPDSIWRRDREHEWLRAAKVAAAQGWAWRRSAPGAALVFAYDRAAGAIRVFDYSDLAAGGVVFELPGAASPDWSANLLAVEGGSFAFSADGSLWLGKNLDGSLELWDREAGGGFVSKTLPPSLDGEWGIYSGVGDESVVMWHSEQREFAVWNLRSDRIRKFPALSEAKLVGFQSRDGQAVAVASQNGALMRLLEDEIDIVSVAQIGCGALISNSTVFSPDGRRAAWSCALGQTNEVGYESGTLVRVGPEGLSTTTGTMMLPVAIDSDGDVVAYSATNFEVAFTSLPSAPRSLYTLGIDNTLRRISNLEPTPELVNTLTPFGARYVLAAPR